MKLTKDIISATEIIPAGKLSNILIKQNDFKASFPLGKNHIAINTPTATIYATIWLSVILDANIPKDIYADASNKKPTNAEIPTFKDGFPKYFNIPKYIKVNNSVIITTNTAAKNFPKTIEVKLRGDVKISCSVPVFLSSANKVNFLHLAYRKRSEWQLIEVPKWVYIDYLHRFNLYTGNF